MFDRKLTALLLAVIIAVTLVPFAAFAETSDTEVSETVNESSTEESTTAPENLTVTVSCGAGGSYTLNNTDGSRPSKHEYYFITGDEAVLNVTSEDGYFVDTVTVDGTAVEGANGKYTFTVNDNHAVVITFKQVETHTITVKCYDVDGDEVTGALAYVNTVPVESGSVKLPEGTEYTVKFVALPGYVIEETQVSGGSRYFDVSNPYEDTLASDTAYRVIVKPLDTYNATVTFGENGVISLNGIIPEAETKVPQGIESTIRIVPDEGYELDKLLINGEEVEVEDNAYTFTPEGDITIEVSFREAVEYCKITLSIGNGGSITVKDELYKIENNKYIYVPVGETVVLVIKPHINYEINTVKVSGKTVKLNEENEYTLECTDTAATVSATFKSTNDEEETTYTVTAYASGGGTISPSGASEIEEGGNITFTIKANEGYEVYSVTVDGDEVTLSGGKYTIKNVSSNMVINATFKKIVDTETYVTVEDIDWTADIIVIDVTEKVNVSTEVFQRAAENYPEKQIMVSDSEFTLVIPAGGDFKPDGNIVSFDFIRNGSPNFVAVQDAISTEYADSSFVTVHCSCPALPVNTTLEIFLGADFSGADLSPLEYLSGALNSIGDTVTADEKGWVEISYSNQVDLAFVEVSDNKATLTVTYNTECGTVDPSGTVKVELGEVKTITVTPNEGYIVSKITLDGDEIDLNDEGVYTVTMDKDHTFTVVFEAPSKANVGLIISLVIIALCVVGGAAVFVLRWRKNQF